MFGVLLVLLAFSALATAAPPAPLTWLAPSTPPINPSDEGRLVYSDSMPLGNGAFTASAWANTTAGGVSILLGHQYAQSSHTELFKLGLLTVTLTPSPFVGQGAYFSQTLDASTASMVVLAGGTNASSAVASIRVWIDANSDELLVDVTSPSGASFSLQATLASTRPPTPWTYTPAFGLCSPISSQPDVFVDPLPAPTPLTRPGPLSAEDGVRRPTAARAPTRTLRNLPQQATFSPATIISYHRNDVLDLIKGASTINMTLTQQGLPQLIASTPDHWTDLQFGVAIDGGATPVSPLVRTSPSILTSASHASAFSLRVTALALQTGTPEQWLTELGAAVVAAPPTPRAAHEAWWGGFWARSYINVTVNNFTAADATTTTTTTTTTTSLAAGVSGGDALPVAGATLWLRASSLSPATPNGSAIGAWTDESSTGVPITQTVPSKRPLFLTSGFGPGVGGLVFDGAATFLEGPAALDAGQGGTIFAVARDDGSTGGSPNACCSGIVYFLGSCAGVSTVPPGDGGADDDGSGATLPGTPIVAMLDWVGSNTQGHTNLRGRPAVITTVYGGAGGRSTLYVDGCAEATTGESVGASHAVQIGTRNDELGRFFKGVIGEVIVFPRALNATELADMHAYLLAAWPAVPALKACSTSNKKLSAALAEKYSHTRYVQAIQSRGTPFPVKFNGMAFTAFAGTSGEPEYRGWGMGNWWQNTRLPYGAMLGAGDFDEMRVILDYYTNMAKFLGPRIQAYFNHSGLWTTETHFLYGAYTMSDYGCSRDPNYPVQYESSGYLHVDQGGDSGTGEWSLMALDYYAATGDPTYLPLAFGAADYFMGHFQVSPTSGRAVIFPAQVLETWWCAWDSATKGWTDCCTDDSPTITGMLTLFEKLRALPPSLTTDAQRAAWAEFASVRMPELPLSADNSTIAPARILSSGTHNDEGPTLYVAHPHRWLTRGREVATGRNASLGVATFLASPFHNENSGWNYAINAAALLGLADVAAAQLAGRATTSPAAGYRFPAYAPHLQDYAPSADHYANFNRALIDMLLQSGDDGFENATLVMLPAWPCDWDVSAKLWGPGNTSVEFSYQGGALKSLSVVPPERAAAVKWASCVTV